MKNNTIKNVAFLSFDGNENGGGVQRVSYLLASGFKQYDIKPYLIFDKVHSEPSTCYAGKFEYSGSESNSELETFLKVNNIGYVINNCVVSSVYTGGEIRDILDVCGCKLISIIHAKPDLFKATPSIYSLKWSISHSDSLVGKLTNLAKLLFFPIYKYYSTNKYIEWRQSIYDNSDRVVVLSRYYIQNLCEMLNVDSTKVRAIPNPLTFEYDCPESVIEEKSKEVLIVSRLEETSKGLSRVFRAWSIVEKGNPDLEWRLSIVGSGPDGRYYQDLCKKLKLQKVTFYGHQPPFDYYKKASVFLMASYHEGLPMTVLEAEQMGLAIIAINNFESLKDLVIDGYNGVLVDDNIEMFAHKIQEVIINPKLSKHYCLNSVENSRRFKLDIIIRMWLKLLNELENEE